MGKSWAETHREGKESECQNIPVSEALNWVSFSSFLEAGREETGLGRAGSRLPCTAVVSEDAPCILFDLYFAASSLPSPFWPPFYRPVGPLPVW